MNNENYKLYKKHQVEIFDIIYDVFERAPIPNIFGFETEEEKNEYDAKLKEYLKVEEPKIKERFKEMGFEIK